MNQIALSSEVEAKIESGRIASAVASDIKFEIDPATLKPKFSPAIKSSGYLGGEKWYEMSVSSGPLWVRVDYSSRPLKVMSASRSHSIEGEVTLALTVTRKPDSDRPREPVPVRVKVPAINPDSIRIFLVGTLAVGAAAAAIMSAPVAVPFAAAAAVLGVIPYDKWKGTGSAADAPPVL